QTGGSCADGSLVFSALRFSKIPLKKTVDGKPVFLRLLFYIGADGTYVVRTTEHLLLSCDNAGAECRYVQIADGWKKGHGKFLSDVWSLDMGEVSKKGTEPYRNYLLDIQDLSEYPGVSGLSLPGTVVVVNFDSQGRTSDQICSPGAAKTSPLGGDANNAT